jgi:hypothetical protein
MATRGTIQFISNTRNGENTRCFVYIHHDMYEEGLAGYFSLIKNIGGNNLATRFVRGISGAEITFSHEWHGDTEYRYDIVGELESNAEITVYKRYYDFDEEKTYFVKKYQMKLKDFIKLDMLLSA